MDFGQKERKIVKPQNMKTKDGYVVFLHSDKISSFSSCSQLMEYHICHF